MLITWLNFRGILFETGLAAFLQNNWMCIFEVKHSIGQMSCLSNWHEMKSEGIGWILDQQYELDLFAPPWHRQYILQGQHFETALSEEIHWPD